MPELILINKIYTLLLDFSVSNSSKLIDSSEGEEKSLIYSNLNFLEPYFAVFLFMGKVMCHDSATKLNIWASEIIGS